MVVMALRRPVTERSVRWRRYKPPCSFRPPLRFGRGHRSAMSLPVWV